METLVLPASEVQLGDRPVFGGRAVLTPVDEIDSWTNRHGLLIIRYGTGWSTVSPGHLMKVVR